MYKIAMIIPREVMDVAKKANEELGKNVTILNASMTTGVEIAKKLENEGYEVIIARGGTEIMLNKSGIKLPTIPLPITPMDILKAINKAKDISEKIGIIAFNNMLPAIESYEEIMGIKLKKFLVSKEEDVKKAIGKISGDDIEVIIGGGIINKYASKYNLSTVVIETGKEVFINAILNAYEMAMATRKEKERAEKFKSIIEYSNDGIISLDNKGLINVFNPSCEKILKITKKDVIGKHIDKVLPKIDISETLYNGIEETEVIYNIMANKLLLSKIPIWVGSEILGAIIIFHDTNKIVEMEEKIRREISSTGHIAKLSFSDILGNSKEIEKIKRVAMQYAKVESTILIEGETGTGKEIMAQSIHNYSNRQSRPFVAVNCAALPESLLESELFGYDPGAFTGADSKGKRGLFELAHGGTIFLDEISEMNPLLQGRLLRVLQEKQVMRIGGTKIIPIDVRVIAATNKNLYDLVKNGDFREDLYYRLNVLKIDLVPLRERKEDIALLIDRFIKDYSKSLGKEYIELDKSAVNYLCNCKWRGNIRELKNFIERLVVTSNKTYMNLKDIKENFLDLPKSETIKEETLDDNLNLTDSEINKIYKALKKSQGKVNNAAKILGISRTTLWRKMKKHNIEFQSET